MISLRDDIRSMLAENFICDDEAELTALTDIIVDKIRASESPYPEITQGIIMTELALHAAQKCSK